MKMPPSAGRANRRRNRFQREKIRSAEPPRYRGPRNLMGEDFKDLARSSFPSTLSRPTSGRLQVALRVSRTPQEVPEAPLTRQLSCMGRSTLVLSPAARPDQTKWVF